MLPRVPTYAGLACPHVLRRHQGEALDAWRAARDAGSRRWCLTMPPGAGKTLVGTEIARLQGRRAVVFSPNTAIQGQWARTWNAYGGPRAGTRRDLRAAFTSLTYQSLAVFDDEEREAAGGGSHVDRLHDNGRALVETLRAAGPLTIVLDECHHLLEVWGELLREVLDSLPEAEVVGLTATPPGALTASETALSNTLFGPILYEARIPALVKEGTLAPYAELAWLVEPTSAEADWLSEQSARWAELTADLFAPGFGSTPLPQWLSQRFVEPVEEGSATWAEVSGREPGLADAALRLAHADLLALPPGAVLHEQHRRAPDTADWRVLLDDWLRRCVQPRAEQDDEDGGADRRVLEAVRRTLPSIGLVWTKRGVRTGRTTVDRVTARSAAKQDAVAHVVTAESAALGDDARVLVLCDHERAAATSSARLADGESPPPQPAGSAVGVLARLLEDPACAALDPLLVTGRTVAGGVATLERLVDHIARTHPGLAGSLVVDEDGEVPRLTGRWGAGEWVEHVTGWFAHGGSRVLVGTRGLLGEGWDAPAVTTLVDLTTATTATAVVQTRGRALRVDPANPEKVALVWTVVCVHEGHVSGAGDWDRFERKHRGYFTLDEHGEVVDGVAGVDSSFSPFHPPPAAAFDEVDARMLVRAEDRAGVRRAWLQHPAYADRVEHVARALPSRREVPAAGGLVEVRGTDGLVSWTEQRRRRPGGALAAVPLLPALAAVAAVVLGSTPWWLLVVLPAVVSAAALRGRSRLLAAAEHRPTLALVAAAVADGLHRAGLSPAGAEAVHATTTSDGTQAFALSGVEESVSALFADAFDEVVSPMASPRYVVRRDVTSPPRGLDGLRRGLEALREDRPDGEVWHTVPSVLARTGDQARAFGGAWAHWVGGGHVAWAGSPEGAGVLATHRGADPFAVTCVVRRVWR